MFAIFKIIIYEFNNFFFNPINFYFKFMLIIVYLDNYYLLIICFDLVFIINLKKK